MDRAIVFDKHTQLERLKGCESLFESLRQEHDVQFGDDEDSFKESAKEFMDILDMEFPQQSDKSRVTKILEYRPDLIQVLDLQKVEKNLKLATELLKSIHDLLSSLKKGHDGLEEKLKRALWLREWLEPRKEVINWFKYIQEDIQKFKTEVHELRCLMSNGMIMTIQQSTVWILLERCDEKLEKLWKSYRVKLVEKDNYIGFVQDLYSVQEKEDPTSGVPMSAAVSRSREIVIADLGKLKRSLDALYSDVFKLRNLQLKIEQYTWTGATKKDSFLRKMDKDIKGYIEDVHQHSQELILLIQQEQAAQ
ncbi:hypothetical protein DPV78_006291 [Talaromyces pinophilus]|nr:hypothetical protein DPV78_006291 [Talaromyces pinophilus]